ncbi:MAG: PAS domain-containing protein, partial [Planktomarina sp.]
MADNERLREVLLEVEALRERERLLLNEGKVGLKILKDLGQASDRQDAIRLLIQSACDLVGAQFGTVLAQGYLSISDEPTGTRLPDLPANLFAKARNLVDLSANPDWEPLQSLADTSVLSALTVPIPGENAIPAVLVLMGTERAQFATQTLNTLKRLAILTEEALRAVDIRANHALLAAVVAGSSSAFAISDCRQDDDPLIFVNAAFETLTGYTRADVLGRNCRFLNAEPEGSPELERLRKTVQSTKSG